ncbi:MAG: energy-coupling factor transporter transmembrane protein EcfT [Bacteroidetes bacterium]|nr:energy-coupling factor transporter transmembrane protein EcfT [Bacteroidota bacterium]
MSNKSRNENYGIVDGVHPLAKLIILFMLIGTVLFIPLNDCMKNIFVLMGLFLFISLSKFRKKIIKKALLFSPMIFVITFLVPFKGTGDSLVTILGFSVFKTGLFNFASLIAKMFSLLLFANFFAATTSILDLVSSLQSIKVPDKLLSILFLVNRFIAMFQKDVLERGRAFRSRQIKMPKLMFLKYIISFLATIFMDLFEKNERIFNSLYSRGFAGKITSKNQLMWARRDSINLMIFLLFICLLLAV